MSHAVTITRTTTTTSSSAIILYTGYLKTLPGILKLVQTLVNIACVGILGYYFDHYGYSYYTSKSELFFLLVAVTFLINTALLFITSLISFGTASILPKTVYEYWYHATAFFLYISAGLSLIIQVSRYGKRSHFYEEKMAAAVLGLVNAGLYLVAAILSYRSCRLG